MIITEDDVARMPEAWKRELILGYRAQKEFAVHEQNKLTRVLQQAAPQHHMEGLGRRIATISAAKAADLRSVHGMNCLHDPEFIARELKRDPSLRNGSTSGKTMLRVDGLRDVNGAGHVVPGDPAQANGSFGP